MDVKSKGALPRLVVVPTACSLPPQSELQKGGLFTVSSTGSLLTPA